MIDFLYQSIKSLCGLCGNPNKTALLTFMLGTVPELYVSSLADPLSLVKKRAQDRLKFIFEHELFYIVRLHCKQLIMPYSYKRKLICLCKCRISDQHINLCSLAREKLQQHLQCPASVKLLHDDQI